MFRVLGIYNFGLSHKFLIYKICFPGKEGSKIVLKKSSRLIQAGDSRPEAVNW